MGRVQRVAILGAGIMGGAAALMLARKGLSVALFDSAPAPFCGASRWNEGKIHLGHLYAGDPTLATARRVLPGGLVFKPLVEQMLGCSIEPAIARHDDTYLVHRQSVAAPEATGRYFEAVTRLASEHPQARSYLVDVSGRSVRTLARKELERDYDTEEIVAGFRVPERSVSTIWIADRFVDALNAEPNIDLVMETQVLGVRSPDGSMTDRLLVRTDGGEGEPFDCVVNALWQGRLAIDAQLGMTPDADWSHRFRLSLFVRTRREIDVPSTVLATGPFGDVKNYNGRDFYLSWYPTGLLVESAALAPTPPPALDARRRKEIADDVFRQLACTIRGISELEQQAQEICLEGGWVYALGKGSLADPASLLHRRDRIGIQRQGSYFSIDTGKYSIAPWLAQQIAEAIAPWLAQQIAEAIAPA